MSDPEATNPPPVTPRPMTSGPNTPRNLLKHLWDWASAHPDAAIALVLIVAAFLLGRWTA